MLGGWEAGETNMGLMQGLPCTVLRVSLMLTTYLQQFYGCQAAALGRSPLWRTVEIYGVKTDHTAQHIDLWS